MNATTNNQKFEAIFPLSPIQMQLLWANLADNAHTAYQQQIVFRLTGQLDPLRVQQVLDVLIAQYEVLRTVLVYEKVKTPVQVVLKQRRWQLQTVVLPAEADLEPWYEGQIHTPFDLSRDLPVRLHWVQTPENQYLVWTYHHIVLDGWSRQTLLQQFLHYYQQTQTLPAGQPLPVPPPVSYKPFVAWLSAQNTPANQAKWEKYTASAMQTGGVLLPMAKENALAKTYTPDSLQSVWPQPLSDRFYQLARQLHTTPAVVFNCLWALLMQRYTGQTDICFGQVVNWQSLCPEPVFGLTIQTVPFVMPYQPESTWADWVATAHRQQAEMHTAPPPESLQNNSTTPLVQQLVAFENYPLAKVLQQGEALWQALGFRLATQAGFEHTALPLSLAVQVQADALVVQADFNTELYSRAQIAFVLENLQHLAEQVCQQPHGRLREYTLYTPAQRTKIEHWLNLKTKAHPTFDFLTQFSSHWASQGSLRDAHQTYTGEAIAKRFGQIEAYLRDQLAVRPGQIVALSLDVCADYPLLLMAIWANGAVAMPIDERQPTARLEAMLRVSPPDMRLDAHQMEAIDIYQPQNLRQAPLQIADRQAVAYRMFTSGSTGKPKCIEITYQNFNQFLATMAQTLPTLPQAQWLSLAAPTFDIALFELIFPLIHGWDNYLVSQADLPRLETWLPRLSETTFVHAVPTVWQLVLQQCQRQGLVFEQPIVLMTGGDQVPATLPSALQSLFPQGEVWQFYGPTETTILASAFRADTTAPQAACLGKPLAHTQLILLSPEGDFLPPYVWGDLHIGGQGVGKGYVGHPEKDSAYQDTPWGRVYRSGDWARYDLEGNFYFGGRIDGQVKLHGRRIETGEIMRAILQMKALLAIDVVVLDEPVCLAVCYVAPQALDEQEMGLELAKQLPSWMIPQVWVQIDRMPLNAHGKVDKKQLVLIAQQQLAALPQPTTQASDEEETLIRCWAAALDIPERELTPESHFFRVGGNSLRLISLRARILEQYHVAVSLSALTERLTLREMAAWLATQTPQMNAEPVLAEKTPEPSVYPTTAAQKRLLFLEGWEEGNSPYWLYFWYTLAGNPNLGQMEAALNALVQAEELLRTVFPRQNDDWVQVILPHRPGALTIIPVDSLPLGEHPRLDPATQPLWQCQLYQLPTGELTLHFAVHHVLADGQTVSRWLAQWAAAYKGQPWPQAQLSFKQYALESLQKPTSTATDYWVQHLQQYPTVALPTDYPRPVFQRFEGQTLRIALSDDESSAIRQFCKDQGCTLYQFFLLNCLQWLYQHTDEPQVVVGLPVDMRQTASLETLSGMLVQTLPLCHPLQVERSFVDNLQTLQQALAQHFDQLDFDWDDLLARLQVRRDPARNPLFDVSFILQDFVLPAVDFQDFTAAPMPALRDKALFDLSFEVIAHPGQPMLLQIEFATALFKPATVERMADRFLHLCREATRQPQQPLTQLQTLPLAERQRLQSYQMPARVYDLPAQPNVVALFEYFAQQTPQATALVVGEKAWTYAALDTAARQLAHYWHRQQILQKGDKVVLCLTRTERMPIALLACLKAGVVFVPLEAKTAPDRLQYIAQFARVVVDDAWWEAHPFDQETPDFQTVEPGSACYIIFTSGSTGKPKGVQLSHANWWSAAWAWRDLYNIGSQSKILQLAAFSFDVFLGDFARALFNGAALVLTDELQRLLPDEIVELVARQGITHLETTPVMVRMMMPFLAKASLPSLQAFIVGSDVWFNHEYAALHDLLPSSCQLYNSYGLTECTVDSAYWAGDTANLPAENIVPIGFPMAHTALTVRSKRGALCPVGVAGELWIGGQAVGQGYLGADHSQATKFMWHEGVLWFKTGDRVVRQADGSLWFLGRQDNQLKIRGFRVEPAEIEQCLLGYAAVQAVAVAVCQGQLVAFYQSAHPLAARLLHDHCAQQLNYYLIPEQFVWQERLPLTHSGKIDYQKLATWTPDHAVQDAKRKPETSDRWLLLQRIWQEILGLDTYEPHQDFFDLGGNSLKAVQLQNRLQNQAQVQISLRQLFSHPTLEALSALVMSQPTQDLPATALSKALVAQHYPLSPAQRRMWMLMQIHEDLTLYNLPAVYRLEGKVAVERLQKALGVVWQRHLPLRTRLILLDGIPFQVVDEALPEKLPLAICQAADDTILQQRVNEITQYVFDLTQAYPCRFGLIQRGEQVWYFVLNFHHIAFDGWSEAIFLQELWEAYQDTPPLPELQFNYLDYAHAQQQYLQSNALETDKQYWLQQFSQAPIPQIDWGQPRPVVTSHRGQHLIFRLERHLTAQAQQQARAAHISDFTYWLALLGMALRQLTAQDDFIIGTVVAGRNHQAWENLIGLFLNSLALRIKPQADQTWGQYLQTLHQTVLSGFEHQAYPIEALMADWPLPYEPARNPLFDVALVMHNYGVAALPAVEGLTIAPVSPEVKTARLDLTVYVQAIDGEMEVVMEYNTEVMGKEQVVQLWQTCLRLMATVEPASDLGALVPLPALQNRYAMPAVLPSAMPNTASLAEVDRAFLQAFRDTLQGYPLLPEQSFFEAGGHSLQALQLCHLLSLQLGRSVPLRWLYEHPTPLALANRLRQTEGGDFPKPLIFKQQPSAKAWVVFVPPVLGFATVFQPIAQALPASSLGLQHAGIDDALPFEPDLHTMAHQLWRAVQSVVPVGMPLVWVGYSMGALVAFEMVKKAEAAGHRSVLVVLDKAAQPEVWPAEEMPQAWQETETYVRQQLEKLAALDNQMAHSAWIERIGRRFEHNLQLTATYQQQGSIQAPIVALQAQDNDALVPMGEWGNFTQGSCALYAIEGSHYELLHQGQSTLVALLHELLQSLNP